jgi:hypothetical protein
VCAGRLGTVSSPALQLVVLAAIKAKTNTTGSAMQPDATAYAAFKSLG